MRILLLGLLLLIACQKWDGFDNKKDIVKNTRTVIDIEGYVIKIPTNIKKSPV